MKQDLYHCKVFALGFSDVEPVSAMGLSIPPAPVVRIQPSSRPSYEVTTAPIVSPRLDKIVMMANNRNNHMIPLIYLNGHYSYINDQLLKKLRAGDLSANLTIVAIGVVIYVMCQVSGVDAFAIFNQVGKWNAPQASPAFGLGPGRGSTVQITRPTAMPHQEFTDLTKEERRQVTHDHDKIIDVKGHPQLRVGFWQSRYKVVDHGAIHGLPYSIKENGGTRTEKSDDNALLMMQSIEDMPHRPKAIWFDQDDVIYQGGTDREFPAVYIFDDDTKVIAVFNKKTGNFITTCQLEEEEEIELKATHNFGGREDWTSGRAKNLPPRQTTKITPISPMDKNSSPGFTPTSSFESDIMGITSIDNSQLDNP